MQDYRRLRVWSEAMRLTRTVYRVTASFPGEERFGLSAQMRRCAVSIASNIAEGTGRRTRGEFLHFLGIARGSAHELETQALTRADLGYLDEPEELISEIGGVIRMLVRLSEAVDGTTRRDQKST